MNLIEILFNELSTNEYELKETHQFTMVLPKIIIMKVLIIIG